MRWYQEWLVLYRLGTLGERLNAAREEMRLAVEKVNEIEGAFHALRGELTREPAEESARVRREPRQFHVNDRQVNDAAR